MGIPMSLLRKAGLPGVGSVATDQVFEKYFKDIKDFDAFHRAFIALCNEFNTILPGKHYKAPSEEEIKKLFDKWTAAGKKKETVIDFMKEDVKEHKPNQKVMILTGMAAPPAVLYLKKTGENTPQLKKFRLHFIPNVIAVPTFTLLALAGVRALQMKSPTPS
ncbi:uncharacterized protein LOC103715809 [Phoenix dactylifera]|uniref:Uncharacterized protein LOC103715809 n=1 Tax=Phoenix dactylifera TaxID=42345 RepID=A0A8B7CLW9_PHODC|nr:uncharacterized protein LOC103715809 [Phoenix dactylifera]